MITETTNSSRIAIMNMSLTEGLLLMLLNAAVCICLPKMLMLIGRALPVGIEKTAD